MSRFSLTSAVAAAALSASACGNVGSTNGAAPTGSPGSGSGRGGQAPLEGPDAAGSSSVTSTASGGSPSGQGTGGAAAVVTTITDPSQVTRIARLTHDQYDATIADLLGITDGPSNDFAPDALNGFRFATSINLRVDARLGPQYRAAAEDLAARSVSDDAVFERIVSCEPPDAECAATFVETFGLRAFRRPLAEAEQARFETAFAQGAALVGSGDDFRDGVRLVVEAMLQSPQFLYRTELSDGSDTIALNGWEIASRLSYFLWGSMPDDELFALASRGELASVEQVTAAAERMLEDPRALRQMVSFHEQAWDFARFTTITPDAETYPDVPSDVVDRVHAASRRFVEDVVSDGGGLAELLTAPYAFADDQLAPIYDASVSGGLERVDFDPSVRKGYLMQIGFLASHAYSVKTDPIHRGLFVARELLCQNVPDPPAGASQTEPPEATEPIETTRDEITLLTGQQGCFSCHALINPAGFAFEGFDAIGRHRDDENGAELDTSGSISMDGADVPFDGAPALVDALAASGDARRCYASKWLEYAYGRNLVAVEQEVTDGLAAAPASAAEIVARIVTTAPFLTRAPNEVGE